jgi:hypothetical protein
LSHAADIASDFNVLESLANSRVPVTSESLQDVVRYLQRFVDIGTAIAGVCCQSKCDCRSTKWNHKRFIHMQNLLGHF